MCNELPSTSNNDNNISLIVIIYYSNRNNNNNEMITRIIGIIDSKIVVNSNNSNSYINSNYRWK